MHYSDGREARLHDVVRGKPYNTPHEVTGVVVGLEPGPQTCNMAVAFAGVMRPPKPGPLMVVVKTDYGQVDQFNLLDREIF